MKRILTFALCAAAIGSMCAQKQAVSDAKKLAGKTDKIEEARNLIKGAMQNPETARDAQTYFVAGDIEYKAYDNARAKQMINPQDPNINTDDMGNQLINGYAWFLEALPLDSLPDEKGKVKPKYSKDIISKVASHTNDYFQAGVNFYNNKKFFPESYKAFMIYADMPNQAWLGKNVPVLPDADRASAYFNAGVCAYSGNDLQLAIDAFRKARLLGSETPENYIYEIASWQSLAQNDSTQQANSQKQIFEIAQAGHKLFGLEKPVFINNIINYLVFDGKSDEAMRTVNDEIAKNADAANLYGLRAFINSHNGNFDAAEADYRKAASLESADFETLKNASRMLYRIGAQKWNEIDPSAPDAAQKKAEVKSKYWGEAMKIADKATTMNPNDAELNDIIDSIEYNSSLN